MIFGAVYPQIELNGDPAALDAITRAVEAQGYDHIVLYDHVVGAVHEDRNPPLWGRGPYTDKHPFHDPLVAFGYMAGITKTLEFVSGVLILPQRQTVLVAKQATDVDLLSGGRLHLGVGTGWNYVEYDALGEDFSTRGAKMDEQIPYLRQLWESPLVTFDGKFHKMDRANIIPRPRRRIPIYCGGFAEPAWRRAAKLADGFIFPTVSDDCFDGLARLKALLKAEGRSVEDFRFQCIFQDYMGKPFSPSAGMDQVRRCEDAGVTHISVVSMAQGMTTAAQHIDYFGEMADRLKA